MCNTDLVTFILKCAEDELKEKEAETNLHFQNKRRNKYLALLLAIKKNKIFFGLAGVLVCLAAHQARTIRETLNDVRGC